MTNLTRKVASGLATGALLTSMISQVAFADTNITISGNARGSDNDANVNMNSNTTVTQSNTAVVTNVVTNNTNTGGNRANDNSGDGGVSIHTGSSTSNTTINNALNQNKATVSGCGACAGGNTNVQISDNGRNSDNTANLNNNTNVAGFQTNNAVVTNLVTNNANTGNNRANDNMSGNGGVDIHTGPSTQSTTVNTVANSNAMVVGGTGAGTAGTTNLLISGNLRGSDNDLNVNMNKNFLVTQDNLALVTNSVVNNANSGENDANDNSGMVSIHTGAVKANTTLNTAANFNAASLDCGCMMNVNAKAAGNGRDSDNTLNGNFNHNAAAFQGQTGIFGNFANSNLNSGTNDSNDNGGGVLGDPAITTEENVSNTTVNTSGNTNIVGPAASWMLPNGNQVNLTWSLNGMLMAWFGFLQG